MSSLDYLKEYSSRSTVQNYRRGITLFLKTIRPGQIGSQGLEATADAYITDVKEQGDVEKDVKAFFASSKSAAPKTIKFWLSAVRVFLTENGVELPDKFWRGLRRKMKGGKAITAFRIPSVPELRKILTHMDAKGRAFFLVMASSGMRIGEVLALKMDDLELTDSEGKAKDPVRIRIRASKTKTGSKRVSFISTEAREAVQEWIKVREKYVRGAAGKSHIHKKGLKDDRLFPFEVAVAHLMWRNAVKKAGLAKRDGDSKRWTMTPHCLRKFTRTRLGTILSQDVSEALIGHEGYLTEVYRKHSEDDLANFYKQAEAALMVFHAAEEVSKLREEVHERDKQLQEIVNGLAKDNLEVRDQNRELLKRLEQNEKEIARFREIADAQAKIDQISRPILRVQQEVAEKWYKEHPDELEKVLQVATLIKGNENVFANLDALSKVAVSAPIVMKGPIIGELDRKGSKKK